MSYTMENLTKKSSRRSLFDSFTEDINNEDFTSDISNNREQMSMDDENSSIDENTNLNEDCNSRAMVKYFLKTIICDKNIKNIFNFL